MKNLHACPGASFAHRPQSIESNGNGLAKNLAVKLLNLGMGMRG